MNETFVVGAIIVWIAVLITDIVTSFYLDRQYRKYSSLLGENLKVVDEQNAILKQVFSEKKGGAE